MSRGIRPQHVTGSRYVRNRWRHRPACPPKLNRMLARLVHRGARKLSDQLYALLALELWLQQHKIEGSTVSGPEVSRIA